MRILSNVIATLLVAVLLGLIYYLVPTFIVECEWRNEQSANEQEKTTAYELRAVREDFIGRAQRAFKSAPHSRSEIESFLTQYTERIKPYYTTILEEDKWIDVSENAQIEITYNNALVLLLSYSITTGYENIQINSTMGKAVLVIFAYFATVLLSTVIGCMSQLTTRWIRKLLRVIIRIDNATKNPNKMSYKYMWDLVKIEATLLVINFILAAVAVFVGAIIMKRDQIDWSWSMALIYAQATAFTTGHTKYIPDPVEGKRSTVLYAFFLLALNIWMTTFLTMFLASAISLARGILNTRSAEISEEEYYKLKETTESRKRQRQLDNPKYEE